MADKGPWPLVVTSVICDLEAKHVKYDVDLLRAHMDNLYRRARKMLEEAGRMSDLRRLTLVCHNEDRHIVRIDRNQSPTGEGK